MRFQPYQIFFPIGIAYAVVGVVLWPLFSLGWIAYPAVIHAHFMALGFLLQFVMGFLLTSVPKMTVTTPIQTWEKFVAYILSALPGFALVSPESLSITSPLIALTTFLFILFFFLTRRVRSGQRLPELYDLIGVGLAFGALGAIFLLCGQWFMSSAVFSEAIVRIGKVLMHQAMIYTLTLGVGSSLIQSILEWSQDNTLIHIGKKTQRTARLNKTIALSVLILASALGNGLAWDILAIPEFIRAALFSWMAIHYWRLHHRPVNGGSLAFGVWVSAWGSVVGLWLQALRPNLGVHALHITLIGGFGLMTLLIASRVSLAHVGYSLAIERRSRLLSLTIGTCLLAALTRLAAPLIPNAYFSHLTYAALTFLVACLLWSIYSIPRILGNHNRARKWG